jgi:hypothetical protein
MLAGNFLYGQPALSRLAAKARNRHPTLWKRKLDRSFESQRRIQADMGINNQCFGCHFLRLHLARVRNPFGMAVHAVDNHLTADRRSLKQCKYFRRTLVTTLMPPLSAPSPLNHRRPFRAGSEAGT